MVTGKSTPIRIVLIDDHEFLRIGVAGVLNHTPGMTVVGQSSRLEHGRQLVVQLKPDVLLLDISFPDGSGVDVARDMLADCPTTRVLFLTSFGDEHTVLEAVLSGVHGFLLKDISPDELIRAIQTVAFGERFIDPRVMKQSLDWVTKVNRQPGKPTRRVLSPQEQHILPLIAQGLTNKEIADALQLGTPTVKAYINNICSKLRIGRRSQIASFYARSFKEAGRPLAPPHFPSDKSADHEDLS